MSLQTTELDAGPAEYDVPKLDVRLWGGRPGVVGSCVRRPNLFRRASRAATEAGDYHNETRSRIGRPSSPASLICATFPRVHTLPLAHAVDVSMSQPSSAYQHVPHADGGDDPAPLYAQLDDDALHDAHLATIAEKKRRWWRNALVNMAFIASWCVRPSMFPLPCATLTRHKTCV